MMWVQNKEREAAVGPAAVDEEELLEEAELGDGVVGGHDGLHALFAADSHSK